MSNGKKHGCLWWLFIGWWWWPLIGWWWSVIKWQSAYYQRLAQSAQQRAPQQQPAPRPTPPQTIPKKAPAPEPVKPEPQQKVERHHVAGTSFRLDAIKALGVKNFDYDKSKRELIEDGLTGERIWRTDYFPKVATLEPEPTNPHDPNAIKVVVDGVHIGYIKKGSCARIHKAIREGRIERVKCEIKGGKYKIVLEDFDEDGNSVYNLDSDDVPLYAELYITLN